MRKFLLALTALFVFTLTFAASVPVSKNKIDASKVFIPIGNTGQKISLLDLSMMKVKEVEKFTGKKMNFIDRLTFHSAQRQLRRSINPDGTLNNKRLIKASRSASGETGFHLGGFALGFFLGLIGVLIAYLINDDLKSNRTKWAWIGLGVVVVISLLFLI